MKDFNAFFAKLKENDIWFDQLPLTYRNRDFTNVARQLFTWMLAQEKSFDNWKEIRGWYQKFLWQAGEVHQTPKYDKLQPVNVDNAIPKDDPRYMEYTNKLLEIIKNTPKWQKPVPVLNADEEGAERLKPNTICEPSEIEKRTAYLEHLRKLRECRMKVFIEAYPDADASELEEYLDKFKDIDDPLHLVY